MFTIIINQKGLEILSEAKIAFKRFSILNYIKYTFNELPKNLRIGILKGVLAQYGFTIDYNESTLFFNVNNQDKAKSLLQDLISENITTAEVEIETVVEK